MISISGLTKVYKTKGRKQCRALDSIDLALPDFGLIFILGKSGSGKSTLLNLIGGLDGATDGKIVVNGNDISNLSEQDCCRYRSSQVGFVFQDYHLIDELTVYDNVALSLNLRRMDVGDKVTEALKKVGLEGLERRFPTELSGGERQRVAIARAIIKQPRVILADEPVGNLDTETATAITELLQSLSKDCLIVIVSHNRNDALRYADRIVELSAGKIASDVCRNPDFPNKVTLSDGTLVYPEGHALSDSDLLLINGNREADVVTRKDKYLPHAEDVDCGRRVNIEKPSISHKNALLLGAKFLKNKAFAIAVSSLMIAIVMVVMALAQTIVSFDAGEIIKSGMKETETSSMTVTSFATKDLKLALGDNAKDYYVEITDGEIERFRNTGYTGEIREIYNFFLPIAQSSSIHSAGWTSGNRLNSIFPGASFGTIVANEALLTGLFGEATFVAMADEQRPGGVFVTDYLADAILWTNPAYQLAKKEYSSLLGNYYWVKKSNGTRAYINGVIHTGYKERYNDLVDKYNNEEFDSINDLIEDESFLKLSDEIFSSLGYTYSLNPNFKTDASNSCPYQVVYHYQLSFNGEPYFFDSPNLRDGKDAGYSLSDNEVMMSFSKYNEVFGTSFTESNLNTFAPHSVDLAQYYFFDPEMKNPLFQRKIDIVGLYQSSSTGATFYTSTELFNCFAKNSIFTTGLHFFGTEGVDEIVALCVEQEYSHNTFIIDAIHTMTRAVEVFVPIFRLVTILLCLGAISVLISFALKAVNGKLHDIGIMKALGMQNTGVFTVFGVQVVLIALLTCLLSTCGYFLFIGLANDLLVNALILIAPSRIMLNLNFLTFRPIIALINCGMVLAFSAISLVFPMIKIKRVKPVQIIKSRE